MGSLGKFPYEILSMVNTYAADWVLLESLSEVSPHFKGLFTGDSDTEADREAIRVVESILQQNPVMRYELHCLFRMSVKLRQSSITAGSLDEFMAQDHSLSLMASPPLISPAILKEMVSIAANIQRLACACLTTFLHRVGKVQPRCWEKGNDHGTEPYQPREAGPPSWIEEYRVYRALWYLQLYSDVSIAGQRLNWAQHDVEYWWFYEMHWVQVPVILGEEVRTISECLESLDRLNPILRTTKAIAAKSPTEKKHHFDIRLVSQLPNIRQLRHEFNVWAPPSPTTIAGDKHAFPQDVWGQAVISIHYNRMAELFRVCQLRTTTDPARHQVCDIQDSRPWRGLGMRIWDLWRCYCLGLYPVIYSRGKEICLVPAPDGSVVPQGCFPADRGGELSYRISVFMYARMQMEEHEREESVSSRGLY
ncbi:hypothetical protein ASPBRDRAFT_49202 [Aspergillus brasiliensis CBS 101740]|uniref:F-box domain-containing protein n=1 Tax=Aspergillus brasiliensis (strain CBS 101740 / IMI 381727 / IBT 21946) TaxID=767769 RepID=A0A1L9U369_ASPBC|nr:hypothetical protein ASPBRDRAFT_49202 [Aspergillus brasiliensis CBS 101740]